MMCWMSISDSLVLIWFHVFSCRNHRGSLQDICIYVHIVVTFRRVGLIVACIWLVMY
jgi:hypothetical protein